MIQSLKAPWGLMRILRLGVAIFLIIDVVQSHNWFWLIPAAYLLYQVFTNQRCETCPIDLEIVPGKKK